MDRAQKLCGNIQWINPDDRFSKNGGVFISTFFWDLLGQAAVGAISFIFLVVVMFAFTGQWPPQYMIIAGSIGGALSPSFWRMVRWAQGPAQDPAEDGQELPPS